MTAYREYRFYLECCNGAGVLPWEFMAPEQLMPRYVGQIFGRKCGSEGLPMDSDRLFQAVAKHAGYVVPREEPPRALTEQLTKAATVWRG